MHIFSEESSATLALLHAVASFLKLHEPLWRTSAVEFFRDRLWEHIDAEWWEDLQSASIQELLLLPSGVVQDSWCNSLKDFVKTAKSLTLQRQPSGNFERIFPGFSRCSMSSVLSQGMNAKKQHEVEVLSAVIASLVQVVGASHVVDVGAGQGYLAQVLAFEYGLSVVALDSCAHHADVTNARSQRIKKHYMARARKWKLEASHITEPETATYRVNSESCNTDLPYFLSNLASEKLASQGANKNGSCPLQVEASNDEKCVTPNNGSWPYSFVLAGLHACGDLSTAMFQAYRMCDAVMAIATVGCCYNLLTENEDTRDGSCGNGAGFPLSATVKEIGLVVGRRARDLACQVKPFKRKPSMQMLLISSTCSKHMHTHMHSQSADRWRDVGPESAMYNFEQLALRAAFQVVLHKYHPRLAEMNVSIGRLGKTRRRKLLKRQKSMAKMLNDLTMEEKPSIEEAHLQGSTTEDTFFEFSNAALRRLDLEEIPLEDLKEVWGGIAPQNNLFGPFWTLRAIFGPILETYILLDRLIFLQEQLHSPPATSLGPSKELSEPRLIALFDPELSPRNMAVIAIKKSKF